MKTLLKGKVKQIIINKYWDSHGNEISWGTETHHFDTDKEFEITETKKTFYGVDFDIWNIMVDGKRFDTEFELTGYNFNDGNLILHGCIGAG
jgi:hypothetical protein